MGVINLFRRGPDQNKLAIAEAIAIHQQKNRTQVEHDKQIGIKKDVIRDEKLYNMLDALCYEHELLPVTLKTEDGKEYTEQQVKITGVRQDYLALRSFVSQNNSLRFFTSKDARLFNLETEGALLILETQQPVEASTVEQSVFFSAIAQLAKANNIDSIEGRKLRAVLIDVTRTEVGVGEIQKQKNRLSV